MSDNNSANGVHSYDSTSTGQLIPFFNRNVSEYPTEQGIKFDLVPVTQQKDLMLNAARLHAQQEYDRIMDLVAVLEKQAQQIKRRLDITDWVHAAKFDFKLYPGNKYWLVNDTRKGINRLVLTGPNDWSTGVPQEYNYICQVKWLGDYTWIEVENA
jgi:hypothetical protein